MPMNVDVQSNGNRLTLKNVTWRAVVILFMVVTGGYNLKQIAGPYVQQWLGTAPPPAPTQQAVVPATPTKPLASVIDQPDPCSELARRVSALEARARGRHPTPVRRSPAPNLLRLHEYLVDNDWRVPIISSNEDRTPEMRAQ